MICITCNKTFKGRKDAKFCSSTCRKRFNRHVTDKLNVTDNSKMSQINEISVTKGQNKCDIDVTATPVSVTDKQPKTRVLTNKWDMELNPETNPLKRITKVPSGRVDPDYYKSMTFQHLVEELDQKSITQLEKEGYWIPAWKLAGKKRPFVTYLERQK